MQPKIPNEMQKTYEEISQLLIDYSSEYLNKEYEELCLHALEKLCRKRPSPLKSGTINGSCRHDLWGKADVLEPYIYYGMLEKNISGYMWES